MLSNTRTQFLAGHARGVVFVNEETNNACEPQLEHIFEAFEKKLADDILLLRGQYYCNLPHPTASLDEHPHLIFSWPSHALSHCDEGELFKAYTSKDLHCFIKHNMYHVKWFDLFDLSKDTSSTYVPSIELKMSFSIASWKKGREQPRTTHLFMNSPHAMTSTQT